MQCESFAGCCHHYNHQPTKPLANILSGVSLLYRIIDFANPFQTIERTECIWYNKKQQKSYVRRAFPHSIRA